MSLIVRTLSEQIFAIVRERIISGVLPRDTPIRQDALATELGVSKIPLREALARLEQEGLLTSQANRGFFVRPMSATEAEEIYELRLALEPEAAARACLLATADDQQAAREAFADLDIAAHEALHDVAVCNRAFHIALVAPLGRPLTMQLVERLQVLAERYVITHLEPAGRDDRAHREHHDILEAWLARDADRTAHLLTGHLNGTLTDLRAQLATD
ncbi:GntR family transcriptional regulator [Sphingomonas carotinifaciens]|uniref:GntR family transcriptional regulator n=1 Tax=Sphingomonas carotinifaciens TaxID=1166323 RepID=UPI000DD9A4AA|nr:GntR family transcriptional regulator [Sphingomonas carotinifaciens]